MNIHFEKVISQHLNTIFEWLPKNFVAEFWNNTQTHKDDIIQFVNGRKVASTYADGKYVYWIAWFDNEPFERSFSFYKDVLGFKPLCKSEGSACFLAGNPDYLGCSRTNAKKENPGNLKNVEWYV